MQSALLPVGPVISSQGVSSRPHINNFKNNVAQARLKHSLREAWESTAQKSPEKHPIDVLLCPASPSAGYEHDFLPWWGYTMMFNITDFPSTVIPLKNFKISSETDPKESTVDSGDNEFAIATAAACMIASKLLTPGIEYLLRVM